MIEHGNINNFDSLISNDKVLVDFYADWCGPCKMLAPVLEELANNRSEVKIVKINVDNEEELSRRFGVMSIPTLILFKNGKEIDKRVGFMSLEDINEWIN